jgi:hypothetical protein
MVDKMERFSQRARRVLSLAHEEAERLQHDYIGTEHLLIGLVREEGGIAGRVLRELGLDQTGRMGHHYITTQHLLLGIVRLVDGVGMDVLRRLGLASEQIHRQTRVTLAETPTKVKRNVTPPPAQHDRKTRYSFLSSAQMVLEASASFDAGTSGDNKATIIRASPSTPPFFIAEWLNNDKIQVNFGVSTEMIHHVATLRHLGNTSDSPPGHGIDIKARIEPAEGESPDIAAAGSFVNLVEGRDVVVKAAEEDFVWNEATGQGYFGIVLKPQSGYSSGDQVMVQLAKLEWKETGGDKNLLWQYGRDVTFRGVLQMESDYGTEANGYAYHLGPIGEATVASGTEKLLHGWQRANFAVFINQEFSNLGDGQLLVTLYGVSGTTNTPNNQGPHLMQAAGPGEDPDLTQDTSGVEHLSAGETLVINGSGGQNFPTTGGQSIPALGYVAYFSITTGDQPHDVVYQIHKVEWVVDQTAYALWELTP